MGPMDGIKPAGQIMPSVGSWAFTPPATPDIFVLNAGFNPLAQATTQKISVPVENHSRVSRSQDNDLGLGIGIGVAATVLIVGAAKIFLHRKALKQRAFIEDVVIDEIRKAVSETDVGRQWIRMVRSREFYKAREIFPRRLVTLVNMMSLLHQLDRRAESRLGQMAPSAVLGSYWKDVNADGLGRLMDWVTEGAYYRRFNSVVTGLNEALPILKSIESKSDHSAEIEIVVALYKITLAQMILRSAPSKAKERIRILNIAKDHVADSTALLSRGGLRTEAGALDALGLNDIREELRLLKHDIEIIIRAQT